MKKILALVGVFLLFMGGVAAVLISMPPESWARHRVLKGVKDSTGLDLKINGPMSLRLMPSILLRMEDVALLNPAGAADKPVVTARVVEIRSSIRQIVQSEHRVAQVILTDPRGDIEFDKDGRASWLVPATRSGEASATGPAFVVESLEATGADIGYRDLRSGIVGRLEGARISAREVTTERFAEALVNATSATVTDPANGTLELGGLAITATEFSGGGVREFSGTGATLRWREPGQTTAIALAGEKIAVTAQAVSLAGSGPITLSGGSVRWRDAAGNAGLSAVEVSGAAKTFKAGRIEGLALKSAAVNFAPPARSANAAPMALGSVSVSAPVLAAGVPVDADVVLSWNKQSVTGTVKLPAPETLRAGAAFPTTFALAANGSTLDFDGTVTTAGGVGLQGTAKASTNAVETLARWLGTEAPATVRGPASATGSVDAKPDRIALANGRIQHGTNTVTGSLDVDLGPRLRVSGKLAADKLDANPYLGYQPSKPKPVAKPQPAARPEVVEPEVALGDVFKSYMRAMIDAPITRAGRLEIPDLTVDDLIPARNRAKPKPGTFAWSDATFDLSGLKSFDLDVDWAVKQLAVRGMELNVPQLKTQLNAGTLTLEGRDLTTKNGRLSGKAQIDARQTVPSMTAALRGDGVELEELSEAFGMTPLIEGTTAIVANLTSSGNSQRQLVDALSGRVETNMPAGHVLGYDFGNITLSTILGWLRGNREYDPARRTAISGLKADLNIERGVVRESLVEMGGPFLGVKADGTIRLVEQRLDYRGSARIASIFRGLQFKLFGDLTRPTFQPDVSLASVFSRAPPGEPTLVDILAGDDLKDPELADLIGRVLDKAGARGLDPAFAGTLRTLQQRALGIR